MPDITMCSGNNCPIKHDCYRFVATPDKYMQAIFTTVPYDKKEQTCTHYWNIKLDDRRR